MISLDEILDKHFIPKRKDEINTVLNEFGLEKILICAYNSLIELKTSYNGIQLIESPGFATTIIAAFYSINDGLVSIRDENKRAAVKKNVSELSIRLLFELFRELDIELIVAAQEINKIVQDVSANSKNDFDDFEEHLNLNGIDTFLKNLSITTEFDKQREKKKNTIIWQVSQRSKEELVYLIMRKRKWARKHARLFKLFENPPDNLKIIWNSDHYDELAYLIYTLHKNGIIGCIGNRGCFSAIEKHLFDFNDNKIREGTLKTLSYKINKNWNKFENRLTPVNVIIQAVQKKARNYQETNK